MYSTGIFSEFCWWEWDLNTGKWDLEKKMGWEMGLVPPPPPPHPSGPSKECVNKLFKHLNTKMARCPARLLKAVSI